MNKLVLILLSLTLGVACNRKALTTKATPQNCYVSGSAYFYDSLMFANNKQKSYDTTQIDKLLDSRFSKRSINIAKDMGIEDFLCEFVRQESVADSNAPNILSLKLDIQQRISLANLEVISMQDELECEINRMQEAQKQLSAWMNNKNNKLTIYSLIVGSVATFITFIAPNNEAISEQEQSIGIIGAVATTYFSFNALILHKKIKLNHQRNHLKDIYKMPLHSQIYAPFLWSFLTKKFIQDQKMTSGIELLQKSWLALEYPTAYGDKQYQKKLDLFISEGGNYNEDDLAARIEMYKSIKQEIGLINYDLKRLEQEMIIGKK
ncbi:MAG: hypothetical protein SFU27_12490 [Thermonemataceae bacterium]|nr:hypothetical protein [Thermonemataceae bacterium]